MTARPVGVDAVDSRQLPRYVGQSDVARMLNCSVRTLQRIKNDDPTFPVAVINGKQRIAWRVDDILAWDNARQQAAHARQQAAHARLLASAVSSPDAVKAEELPDALGALAERFLATRGAELLPGDALHLLVERALTDEQRLAVANDAAAKQRELITGIVDRLDGLHFVEALILQRAFLPPLRRFADETLVHIGIQISMSDDEWREAGLLIVDRVINGDVFEPSTHPRDVAETLVRDDVWTPRNASR